MSLLTNAVNKFDLENYSYIMLFVGKTNLFRRANTGKNPFMSSFIKPLLTVIPSLGTFGS